MTWTTTSSTHKRPFYIHLRDGRFFVVAGLWERWVPQVGQPIDSCTIITTVGNELIRPLRVRMPAVLASRDYDLWLDHSVQDTGRLQPLLRLYPFKDMVASPVSTRVNNPANDSPECVAPIA